MKTTKSSFSLTEETTYEGYTFGETWNGHARPLFELETAKLVARDTTMSDDDEYGTFYDSENDVFINKYEGEDYPIKPTLIKTDLGQKTVYSFGDLGWTWWDEAWNN